VSSTVKELVVGSGLQFSNRGARKLESVPGEWHLFALVSSPALGIDVGRSHAVQPERIDADDADLSPRELEVLGLLAAVKSNREIAERLHISQATVATHVRHILEKTGSANRTQAALWAREHDLL
jgi:DNA-binding NarL/FixJ family response regulator